MPSSVSGRAATTVSDECDLREVYQALLAVGQRSQHYKPQHTITFLTMFKAPHAFEDVRWNSAMGCGTPCHELEVVAATDCTGIAHPPGR
mmetsp:Transcript_22047/g.68959  ORF Transcript_22047/g.68959 Transcript_22047/m.68959 type:complete len:90 (-) Transcript_22047:1240-1509(-)